MKNKQQLLTFYLLITTITTHGMNQIVEYSWYNIPTEVKIGFIAQVSVEDKEHLRLVNKELSVLGSTANFPQIVMHYPCILNRDTHLKFMIEYSRQMLDYEKQENKGLLINEKAKTHNVIECLIKNGSFCKHADVLDIVPYFLSSTKTINYSTFENIPINKFIATIIAACKYSLYRQDLLSFIMPYAIDVYDANEVIISSYMERYCKTETLTTHLHIAVEEGDTAIAELFIAQDPTLLHEIDGNGMIPLSLAAQGNNLNIIKIIKKYDKQSIQQKTDPFERSPYYIASLLDNNRCFEQLLTTTNECTELLHIASFNHHLPTIKMLLDHPKTDVNGKYPNGSTAMHKIINSHWKNDKIAGLRLLLTKNPLINEKNYVSGYTPLICAIQTKSSNLIKFLLTLPNIDIDASIDPQHHLLPSIFQEDEKLKCLILPYLEDAGLSPLLYAVKEENLEIIKLLVAKGANINYKTKDGTTALDLALKRNDQPIIDFLCSQLNIIIK